MNVKQTPYSNIEWPIFPVFKQASEHRPSYTDPVTNIHI